MGGIRRRVASTLLAVGSIALTLLVLEGVFRVARRHQGKGKEEDTIALYTEHDPLLGWRKKPGGRATFQRREYTIEVLMNSHGLRDKERRYEADGSFRILAIGDSFVEAYSVPLAASVTQVLESSISRPTCAVEVINGGTAAWSTDQEYLFYLSQGRRYAPDVVIVFLYFDDVVFNAADSYFGSPKPILVEAEGGLRLRDDPVPKPPPPEPRVVPTESAPQRGSALLAWVKERLGRGAPRLYNSLARVGLWPEIPVSEPPLQMKVFKRRRVPEVEEGWAATSRILEAFAREVRAQGARFLIVYVPSRMEVNERDWELTQIRYGADEGRWDRGRVVERLSEIAIAADIPLLDLTDALRRANRGVFGGAYYVHDGHWSATGHRAAASAIGAFLTEKGWLPGCTP